MDQPTLHIYRTLLTRLAAVRRKESIVRIVYGTLFSGAVLIATLLAALILEETFYLDVPIRTGLFWILVASSVGLCAWYIVRPLFTLLKILPTETNAETARKVGQQFPRIQDHLVNILDLYRERVKGILYSSDLIDASFEDARREMEPLDFTSVVSKAATRRMSRLLAVAVGAAVLLGGAFPTAFFGSADRLLHYGESFAAPVAYRLRIEPGNKEIVKGETVSITIYVQGSPQHHVSLFTKPAGEIEYEEHKLAANDGQRFTHDLPALKLSTTYFARSGDVRSDEYLLTMIDRPMVRMLRLRVASPSYAGLPVRHLDDNIGDVTALKGSRVSFVLEANKNLTSGSLVFGNDDVSGRAASVPPLDLSIDGHTATGSFVLSRDHTYHIVLHDEESLANAEPIKYTLKIIPDAFPSAVIELPGRNLDVAENTSLNMLFKITDDYGFTKLRLASKLMQSRYERPADEFTITEVPLPRGIRNEGTIAYLWLLDKLSLVPEDVVSYYVEVFDNDNISGPKSARSEIFTLRLPSLEEVFADLDKGHEESLETLQEALKEAQEAKRELDEFRQEQLKKNQQKMDWQDQKKAEELTKKYGQIQKKMDEVNAIVEQMTKEMERNQVLSKETMEKYQELQQMMEDLNSPEFAEAMKRMQQAMQQLSPEQMKQALQQFNFSEENFRKSIERTMNLLKRIQIEQKVDEAVKRAEHMLKQQEELQKKTEQTNPIDKESLKDLAEQQKDLKEQLKQLQKQLADLQEKMKEFPTEMPLSELNDAEQQLEEGNLDERMEQIAQQMQQSRMQQAMQGQKQAMQKMGQFMRQMQQMQKSMQQNQQRQIVNEMRRALQDLLELSKRQEELKGESQRLEQNSQQFRENAQEQMQVMRDLASVTNSLSGLSQKTFGISPEMGKSIGDALREMNSAMQALEQRNGTQAGQRQGEAMASLNAAASQLQGSMNAMMQGGGQGMGLAGLMQRLQQMTGKQQGINQATQQMGGMSPQQAAEMARLAGEQGMVRKSLEQLAKEAANSGQLSKLLGDLNKIAQDMREVQTDLAQGNVNPETLRKQERILSRMLDSQRSARERDFEKRRKAESGTNVARRSPGAIDLTTQEGRAKLRMDLLRAMEEGYARDYEELIKKYFEALEQVEQ